MAFIGAKIVLLIGDRLVTLLRDDDPAIAWPGWWDLPGGGREGDETPEACVVRETREEIGLTLEPAALLWRSRFDDPAARSAPAWWFAAALPAGSERHIVFGNEGQGWRLMEPAAWLAHPRAIPHFKSRVRAGLAALETMR